MKVREMIALLTRENPEAVVVTSGSDHSYDEVRHVVKRQAEVFEGQKLLEYYDTHNMSDEKSPVVDVVLFS